MSALRGLHPFIVFGRSRLALGHDESRRAVLLAMVRADEKEPHVTIREAALVEPEELVQQLLDKGMAVGVVPLLATKDG